jgi:hypothetical protein
LTAENPVQVFPGRPHVVIKPLLVVNWPVLLIVKMLFDTLNAESGMTG